MTKQIYYIKLHGYKYLLKKDYFYNIGVKGFGVATAYLELSSGGLLRIKAGYAWDGASGPTFDSRSSMRGSLIHDSIYQLIRLKKLPLKYRKTADYLLEQICLGDGMWRVRAYCWERAVRFFASLSARPGSERPEKILCAPED